MKTARELRWIWRYIYWPLVRWLYKNIKHPNIQPHLAFRQPLAEIEKELSLARWKSEQWREKYIKISKEYSTMKTIQPQLDDEV